MDINNGLGVPLVDSISVELHPAVVNYHLVELDGSTQNVLGALGVDFGLGGHLMERFSIDVEEEVVGLHIVAKLNLPHELIVLQIHWEQARVG